MRLYRYHADRRAEVYAKLESPKRGWQVKDRMALAMIEHAERRGLLRPGATTIEPTAGSSGIGLPVLAACRRRRTTGAGRRWGRLHGRQRQPPCGHAG